MHFLRRGTKLSVTSWHTDRGMAPTSYNLMASLRSVMVLGFPGYMRFEICTRSVFKGVMDLENFVLSLKKCTKLNGGHLVHML